MKNLVNIMTISRIFVSFFIFFLITLKSYLFALILFVIASLTDYLDGYLARKYKVESDFGRILDPIADKILISVLFIALSINLQSYLIGFLGCLVLSRDFWVNALRDLSSRRKIDDAISVTMLAKFKTASQMLCFTLYLLGLAINLPLVIVIADITLIISTILSVYTGFLYTISFTTSIKK